MCNMLNYYLAYTKIKNSLMEVKYCNSNIIVVSQLWEIRRKGEKINCVTKMTSRVGNIFLFCREIASLSCVYQKGAGKATLSKKNQ